MHRNRGFTLIELLIVISIISILAALIIVIVVGLPDKAKMSVTKVFIETLDRGCEDYRQVYGKYPPPDGISSSALHRALGGLRYEATGYREDGTPVSKVQKKPFIEFRREDLKEPKADPLVDPSPIMDAWGNEISYRNPGVEFKEGVDVWSMGPNGEEGDEDDVANYIRE